jgi:predicted permease
MLVERVSSIWLRARALVHRRRLDRDLDDELAFHLAMRAEKYGSDLAAQAKANRQFGNATRIRETCRELWTFAPLETLWQDLRYAGRTLARTPAFTTVALLSLALGIGANTALFSLMDVMLLRALPVQNPQELVEFVTATPRGSMMTNLPYPVFEFFRQDRNVLSDVFAIRESNPVLRGSGRSDRVTAHEVSGAFFRSLGVQPLMGRAIFPEDDRTGAANRVAVISYAFWSRRFGRSPSALGASVRLSGELFTVIGVMPPEFFGVDRSRVPDLWVPLAVDPDPGEAWVLGRLRPGVSVPRARALLEPLFHRALESVWNGTDMKQWPEQESREFLSQHLVVNRATEGTSGVRWSYWDHTSPLKILIGLTGLVLLIACANLANLLTARSAARSREISIRLALGAGRWRLVRQLLTENLLLAFAGGALGLLIAGWGHQVLLGFLVRDPLSVALDYRLDPRVLGFGLALSLATGLLFGLMPAIRATRAGRPGSLHNVGRQAGASHMPLAKGLIVIQVGLSTVLLIGAGLFARSLRNLGAADLGLERENLMLMDVRSSAKTPQARQKFWAEVTRRLSEIPGVRNVALAGDAVFGNGGWNNTVFIAHPGQPAQYAHIAENYVSPGFFATAGIPIITGREFGERDRANTPGVVVVNLTFARLFFPGDNPIGQRLGGSGDASARTDEIVGVVGDAKYGSVREKPQPMYFHSLWQATALGSCVVHVRAVSEPILLEPSIRREIQAIDDDALVGEMRTMPQIIRSQLREDRMFATLASFFALLALALGAIGIYGIVAYRVAQRTAEIGVRMALGAQRRDVLWLIIRETLLLLAVGAAVGVPTALAGARFIKSQLFALDSSDPLTFTCAIVAVFMAGALAAFLPAWRAASAEPMLALQSD